MCSLFSHPRSVTQDMTERRPTQCPNGLPDPAESVSRKVRSLPSPIYHRHTKVGYCLPLILVLRCRSSVTYYSHWDCFPAFCAGFHSSQRPPRRRLCDGEARSNLERSRILDRICETAYLARALWVAQKDPPTQEGPLWKARS